MSLSLDRATDPDEAVGPIGQSEDFEAVKMVLRLASVARAHFAEVLNPHGLSWARYEVLELVSRHGSMSYRELSRTLVRHRTSVKPTVASLRELGLVSVRTDVRWNQRLLVEPTAAGVRAVRRAEDALQRSRFPKALPGESNEVLAAMRRLEIGWTASR